MNIKEKLLKVQIELKAPKNQRNNFGGYNYRSCEDILEAVKPLLEKNNMTLTISDDIIQVGEKYFVKSIATVQDLESEETITNQAFAEIGEHKGMSSEQTTGTCSSYCRKYCLNGLFLIDDQKDADTDEYQKQEEKKATEKQITILEEKCTDEEIEMIYKKYKIEKLEDLSMEIASKLISRKLGNG